MLSGLKRIVGLVPTGKHVIRSFCTSISPLPQDSLAPNIEYELKNPEYEKMTNQFINFIAKGHRTMVVQPRMIFRGYYESKNTTVELQLDEACALVESLPYWSVGHKMTMVLGSTKARWLFGAGQLHRIKREIQENSPITALFIGVDILKHSQKVELENELGVEVYDRYSMVIHIFRQHAKSPEAKLQVALAELPYVYRQLSTLHGKINFLEKRRLFLHSRKTKLEEALKKLKIRREKRRQQRVVSGEPSIAIVGYTNCGKTTLIKALTGDENLQPRNQLFATLDTTAHKGLLPCKMKVSYIDTIGFIQDIPETLIEPFVVTLEDALEADVIVHLYDASHPDMPAQLAHVRNTIDKLTKGQRSIIEVANKCDLIEGDTLPEGTLGISAAKSIGIDVLNKKIQDMVLESTDRIFKRMRVGSGSLELAWLYKETTVLSAEADPTNSEVTIVDCILTGLKMEKFKNFLRQTSQS